MFPVPKTEYVDNDRTLKLTTADGCKISAIHMANPKAEFTILYSHGNGEDLGYAQSSFDELYNLGFSVFAYDYHGYGTSEGRPTEKTVYMDINAAYDYLINNLKIPSCRIIVYGRSIGSGPSVDLASRKEVAGLILQSPLLTAFRCVTRVPIVPFDSFSNISKIDKVRCPLLVMHGTADEVIPFSQGKALFDNANEPKTFVRIEGGKHNEVNEQGYHSMCLSILQFRHDLSNSLISSKNDLPKQ